MALHSFDAVFFCRVRGNDVRCQVINDFHQVLI